MWRLILPAAMLALAACGGEGQKAPEPAPSEKPAPTPAQMLDQVLAGAQRTDAERARDAFRHPKETLLFFGIEPDMTVVEVYPGGGWYTQVLAPYLKAGGGKLYAASWNPEGASPRIVEALEEYRATYVDNPEIYGDVELTVLGTDAPIAPPGAADAVVTFRNIHGWLSADSAEAMFQSFYDALKPGGVLGVVQHRADGADPALPRDGSDGYVYTDDVIALAKGAGFELLASSEINANPADTKDHPFGVWTLPPSRRASAVAGQEDPGFDRAKYEAIGESDRMTLKFVKPAAVDGALFE